MAAIAQSLPESNGRFAWFWGLVREEMAPYRGRAALVARMVTASTLVMIISMTFRIPYGAYGAVFALTISRESLEGTTSAVRALAVGLALGGAYVVVGAMLVLGNAMLRFLWVGATLFLIFYALSALSNYTAAARFGYLTVITISLWDSHISVESKVENTLWAVGAITLASVITLLLEIIFAAFRPGDELVESIAERLICVEELLTHYSDDQPVDAEQSAVTRLAIVGTSRLRQMLQRSNYGPQREQQMGAVLALVGRLVDIAASLAQFSSRVPDHDRERVRKVAQNIAEIRANLIRGTVPPPIELRGEDEAPPVILLLREIEKTVSLIPQIYTGEQPLSIYAPPKTDDRARAAALVPGALYNIEHVKFGLRGGLAASLCYIAYNALFWPELSTAVTTCLLTALTTIGASRQKQFLRFAGALVGGLGIGMGAQVFILPYIDSIGAFTVLFAVVIGLAAWVATSSPRLSYFGVQLAVAFCLINLLEFKIQTSLAVARDRVAGVVLGLFMMWLAFDRLWSSPAGVEMKKGFISILRSLAQFVREPASKDIREAIELNYALRETINAQFDKVRSLADGVLFEFGASRQRDLALRDHIRRWQPQLRTLFVMRIASFKYRLRLPGFELPEAVEAAQQVFDDRIAAILEDMATRMETETRGTDRNFGNPLERLERAIRTCCLDAPQESETELRTFLALSRNIESVTRSLDKEI